MRKRNFLISIDKYPLWVYNIVCKIPRWGIIFVIWVKTMSCEKCEKTTLRTDEQRKKLLNRLNRIEGQIRGIKGMIEKDSYCTDILTQCAAVNAAVNSFNKELLACHIRSCVVRDIREGNDEVIDELVMTLQKLMK